MTGTLAALRLATAVVPLSAQSNPMAGEVVTTAQTLSQRQAALKPCIARDPPADQKIAAKLVHADNQFLAGDDTDARSTLRRSIGRSKEAIKE